MTKELLIFVVAFLMIGVVGLPTINKIATDIGSSLPNVKNQYQISNGEAWLSGWDYRQALTITGQAGAGVNYQIKIMVNYDAAGDLGEINCSSKCLIDFGDIRFTDNDGNTELFYWMEEYTSSDDGTFWVKVADNLDTAQTIYIYYGKSGETTTSNGDNTFIFFDDFENNNFNRWTTAEAQWSVVSSQAKYGTYSAYGDSASTNRMLIKEVSSLTTGFMIHSWVRFQGTAGMEYPLITYNSGYVRTHYAMYSPANEFSTYDGTQRNYFTNGQVATTWQLLEIGFDFVNGYFRPYIDGVYKTPQLLHADDGSTITEVSAVTSVLSSTANQDHWLDDYYVRKYIVTEPAISSVAAEEMANFAPINDVTPSCTNLDDGDNLYARYKLYEFSVSVTDVDGAYDIDYVELSCMNGAAVVWTVRFDEDTAVYSEQAGPTYIGLTGSTNVTSGVNLDITFKLYIEWAHPDATDYDLQQYVVDAAAASDTDSYTAINYDYETRLDYSVAPLVNDQSATPDRGNLDGLFITYGTLIYYGSGNDYPPSDQIDVWVAMSEYGTNVGPWSDTTLSSGLFSVTCYGDNVVGLDTVTIKPVLEGAGSAGVSQYYTTDVTDTYISDRVQVQSYTVTDNWVNINDNVNIDFLVYYDYDNTQVVNGDFTLNTYDASYVGSGVWRITRTSNIPAMVIYNTVAVSGTNTHGVTTVDQNSKTKQVVWDSVTITMTDPTDQRQNIGANATGIIITITMNYNGTAYGGTATMNNTDYNGDGVNAIRWGYTVSSVNGGTKGITTIASNDVTYMIWDRIQVQSYTVVDDWVNINANVNIDFLVWYDYDNSPVTDGDFTLNGYDASHVGSGVWRITRTSAIPALVTYNTVLVSATNTYGIDLEDQNSKSRQVVWDSVTITMTDPADQRQNIGTNATGIVITITMNYNGTTYGGAATMNDTDYNGDNTVKRAGFTVSSVNGGNKGITTIASNDVTYMIWDRIQVQSYTVTDQWVNINANVNIDFLLYYDYDNVPVTDGTATLNTFAASHQGSGVWRITKTSASPAMVNYSAVVCSGNTYGITVVDLNGKWKQVVWDSVTITMTDPADQRQNLNANATGIVITIIMNYNGTVYGGTAIMNNTDYNGNGAAGRWGYTVSSVSGGTYGITTISSNDVTYMIWDSYTVSFTVGDHRINININATVGYTVISDYDSISYDGIVNLNYSTWIQGDAQRQGFTVSSLAGDDTYGITSIKTNDEDYIIWDSYTISFTVGDHRININENATVGYTVISDYDSIVYDGTVNLNYTTWTQGAAQRQGFTVSSLDGDDTYQITSIKTNDADYVIWDSLTMIITGPVDNRINIGANASGIIISAIYDYDSSVFDGVFVLNDTIYNHGIVGIYYYTVASVSGDSYDITAINTNDDTYCIFDALTAYISVPDDQRIDINANCSGLIIWAIYEYDSAAYDGGLTLNDTTYNHGVVEIYYYNVTVADGLDMYGITVISNNGNQTYCIFDSLVVTITGPTDNRININANASGIVVSIIYNYDSAVYDGTFTLNDTTYNHGVVGIYYYTVASANGDDTYGITVIATNDDTYCIFDSLTITITISDNRVNINDNASILVSAVYDYGGIFDGSFVLNDTTYNYGVVGRYGYTVVSVTGDTYDITIISTNDNDYVIFDALTAYVTIPDDQRININDNCTGLVIWIIYEYDSTLYDGGLTLNDTTYNHNVVGIYYYNVTVADGLDTYGITVISNNGNQTYCIFDSITITIIIGDSRINVNDNASITVSAIYDYDSTVFNGSFILNDTTYDYDVVDIYYYTISSVSGDIYGINVISTNDVDYVIFDQIEVYYSITSDSWTNYGEMEHPAFRLRLQYDNHYLNDGSNDAVWINGSVATWVADAFDYWYKDFTYNDVVKYYFIVTAASENTYGITAFDTASATTFMNYIIWDKIIWQTITNVDTVQDYGANGYRVDTGTYVNITLQIQYQYNNTNVVDGNILLNGESMIYIANGYWYLIVQNTTTAYGQDYIFDTIVASGNAKGITYENQNGQSLMVIWDEIFIYEDGCDYDDVFARINVGQNVTLWANAKLRYDNITLGAGDYIEFGDEQMFWNATSLRFEHSYVESMAGLFTYTINTTLCYENTYGITVGKNNPVNLIFDRILIYDMWIDDVYINPGDPVTIYVSLVSEYDNSSMTSGLVQLNGTYGIESVGNINMSYVSLSNWNNVTTVPTFGNWTFIITFANWTIYNLTNINYNGWNVTYLYGIADRIIIYAWTDNSTDNRDDIGTQLNISIWLQYESDGANVTDGSIWITGELLAYLNGGNWTALFSNATASDATWNTLVVSENIRGVTAVNLNGFSISYIWDSYTVIITIGDNRISINENATISFTVISDYDGISYNGTTILNDTTYNHGIVGIYYYTLVALTGDDTYGITSLTNDVEYVIFDRVQIQYYDILSPNGGDISIHPNAYATNGNYSGFSTTYGDYTNTTLLDGSWFECSHPTSNPYIVLTFGGDTAWYKEMTGFNVYVDVYICGGIVEYWDGYNWINAGAILDSDWLNITGLSIFGNSFYIRFNFTAYGGAGYIRIDCINVAYNDIDNRANIFDTITVDMLLYFDYDDTWITNGTFTINGISIVYQGLGIWRLVDTRTTVQIVTYIVFITELNDYNITEIDIGSTLVLIWDRILITITSAEDTRIDYNTQAQIYVSAELESDGYNLGTDSVLYMNDTLMTWNGTYFVLNPQFAMTGIWNFYVNSSSANEYYYSITTVNLDGNSVNVIWDRYTVIITIDDNRINIGDNASIIFTVLSDYDGIDYDGITILNDTTYDHSVIGIYYYTLIALTGDDIYGITSMINDVDYVIFDAYDYTITVNDTRTGVGQYVTFAVTLQYLYDNAVITDGNVYINGSAMAYNGTYWSANLTNNTVGLYVYNISLIINNLYNITRFYDNGGTYFTSVIFDKITFVLSTNMTWTICTYYVNISYAGVYDYDSIPIDGLLSVRIANWTDAFTDWNLVTNASVYNNTYYIVSIISDPSWDITSFTTNIVWCVFDNITPSNVNYYNDVTTYYKIFKITFDQLQWAYNSTPIGANWICKNIRNGTITSTATTGVTSYLSPYLQQVAVPMDWIYLLYTNNATRTIDGRTYDFRWYTVETTVVADLIIRNLIQRKLDTEISVSGSFNTNMTYLVYNEGFLSGEIGILNITTEGQEEGFQLKFDIIFIVGRHNFSIYFAAIYGGGDLWFNQSYYVKFELYIEIPEQKGFNMEVKGTSNLDCEWYVYNRDDAAWVEDGIIPGSKNYFHFLFLLETSVGMHNYSLYFNVSSTVYIWKNGTYYVTGVYGLVTVTLYDGQSNVFEDNNYKMYINGTRSPSLTFYNRTDYIYNLTFTDYFGYVVYSSIYDYDRFIDIELDVYTFKVYSEMSSEFIYFNLTRNGGATFSQHLGPGEILSYRLVAGSYTYDFKKVNGPNFDYYTGSFDLTADTSYIISDISLKQLWLAVESDVGGKTNIKPLMAVMNSMAESLVLIQWTLLILSAVIIGLMIARGYSDEEVTMGANGKTVKKRKLPKVLNKYKFGKGIKNPKFSGMPKNAGQDAWGRAGVTFKKEDES